MREAQHEHAKSEAALESALSHCLMDSDTESLRLARRNRRKSMLLSTGIQAALLTAALVVPLFASQALPLIINDPPIPAPRGIRLAPVPPSGGERAHQAPETRPPRIRLGTFAPPRVPDSIPPIDDRESNPTGSIPTGPVGQIGVRDGIEGLDPRLFTPNARPPAPFTPPEDPRPRGPVEVSKGAQAAKLIYKVEPRYPPLARQIRLEGNVELRAIIARDGTVQNLEVVSGHPLFVQASLDAVRQWRYQPTLLNDKPVEVQTYITVIFRLSRN
jgi:protein TonB